MFLFGQKMTGFPHKIGDHNNRQQRRYQAQQKGLSIRIGKTTDLKPLKKQKTNRWL